MISLFLLFSLSFFFILTCHVISAILMNGTKVCRAVPITALFNMISTYVAVEILVLVIYVVLNWQPLLSVCMCFCVCTLCVHIIRVPLSFLFIV